MVGCEKNGSDLILCKMFDMELARVKQRRNITRANELVSCAMDRRKGFGCLHPDPVRGIVLSQFFIPQEHGRQDTNGRGIIVVTQTGGSYATENGR